MCCVKTTQFSDNTSFLEVEHFVTIVRIWPRFVRQPQNKLLLNLNQGTFQEVIRYTNLFQSQKQKSVGCIL